MFSPFIVFMQFQIYSLTLSCHHSEKSLFEIRLSYTKVLVVMQYQYYRFVVKLFDDLTYLFCTFIQSRLKMSSNHPTFPCQFHVFALSFVVSTFLEKSLFEIRCRPCPCKRLMTMNYFAISFSNQHHVELVPVRHQNVFWMMMMKLCMVSSKRGRWNTADRCYCFLL